MSYRTILVALGAEGPTEARLRAARSLASRFGAILVGMHVMPSPFAPAEAAAWYGGAAVYLRPEFLERQRAANREAKERVRAAFEHVRADDPALIWKEAEGDPGPLLAEAARTADLVIAGQGETVDDLLMATGVPVLMLPPDPADDLGRTVLVAWDGSREATRAAHDALPFLRQGAERVILCAVGVEAAPDLEAAAAMLGRHGVPVRAERVDGPDAGAGEVLLARAAAHGADLLVMGAYGHARLRELVFGGATWRVLRDATLPVLFGG